MGSGIGKRAMKASLTALQRIENLENLVQILNEDRKKLLEAINGSLATVEHRLDTLEMCANATEEVVDKVVDGFAKLDLGYDVTDADTKVKTRTSVRFDDITTTLKRQVRDEAKMKADREKQAIEGAVAAGALVVNDQVQSDTVIVGRELEKDGSVRAPGWIQLLFSEVRPDLKEALLGKKPGESIEMPNGTFEVTSVYKVNTAPDGSEATQEHLADGSAPAETVSAAANNTSEPSPAPQVSEEADAAEALEAYLAEGTDAEAKTESSAS